MLLSLLIFLPLLSALLVALLPESLASQFRWIALAVLVLEVVLAGLVGAGFDTARPDYQLLEQADWITLPLGRLGVASIDYLVGVDGISLPLVLLSAVVMLIGVVASWSITHRRRA